VIEQLQHQEYKVHLEELFFFAGQWWGKPHLKDLYLLNEAAVLQSTEL
jgi:hypothetical protein